MAELLSTPMTRRVAEMALTSRVWRAIGEAMDSKALAALLMRAAPDIAAAALVNLKEAKCKKALKHVDAAAAAALVCGAPDAATRTRVVTLLKDVSKDAVANLLKVRRCRLHTSG